MRIRLYPVVLAVLTLTWTCWCVDAFKPTKSSKKTGKQKKQNQLFNSAKERWNNQLGQPLSIECDEKGGEGVFQVRSEFHANEKDRQYRWQCHTVATEPMTDCTWSNEVNEFQGSLLFMCQSNFVITGISSTYDRKKQDRKWKIKCCRANNHFTRACKISESINRFGKPFFFTAKDECSDPGVMTGLASEINHEKLKDREWKVLQCSYANQKSCKYKCNSIRSRGGKKRKHKRKSQKRKVHGEENNSVTKSTLEQNSLEKTSKHKDHYHHNHHSHHHRGHTSEENNHHHTRHTKHNTKKRHHKVEAKNAKYVNHKRHQHKHRPRHHHHHHNHVSAVNTIETEPHMPKKQPTEKPFPSPKPTPENHGSIVSGLPRSIDRNIYYSFLPGNSLWPTTPMKLPPMQQQQRLLTGPSLTDSLETSLPTTYSRLRPLNSPQNVSPLGPVPLSQPNNIPIQHYSTQPSPEEVPPIHYSNLFPFPWMPFRLFPDVTLNSDSDSAHVPAFLKPLPLQANVEHYWISALYRISELLNWLPFDDRNILRKALQAIVTHHLHKRVPLTNVDDHASTNVPQTLHKEKHENPLSVHIHLPQSDIEHIDTPPAAMKHNNVMQRINRLISRLPNNLAELHLDFPRTKNNQAISDSRKKPHYTVDNSIPPKLPREKKKMKYTDIFNRL